jgi:ribonuclease HIII
MTAGLQGTYEMIKEKLLRHSFIVSAPSTINYGMQFEITKDLWSSVLRVYENKKGRITVDYFTLKGEKAAAVRSIIEDKKVIEEESIVLIYPYIGTDESGKGDTFGPLSVAGVIIDEAKERVLFKDGIKDSKENSDETNLRLAGVVKEVCEGAFEIITVMPEQYNELYKKNKNMNTLLAGLHTDVIKKLRVRGDCAMAIVDQFADSSLVSKNFDDDGFKLHHTTGGEKYTAVAAASILARAAFLEGLKELSERFKIELPKGSSESVARTVGTVMGKNMADKMHLMAKMNFANLKAAIADKLF